MLEKILALNPLRVTPELAALRDSLIEDKLEASCEALDRLLEDD
ncbi:MAG: hypothetical protein WC455_09850 [Dehalococcoidia bacterium]